MSRSRKHQKSPGYDYWGRRAVSGTGHGKIIKKITSGKERAETKLIEHKAKKGALK